MSEHLETKAVELLTKAEDGIEKLTAHFSTLAEQYGQEVIDTGLVLAQITAASPLVYGVVGGILVIFGVPYAKRQFALSAEINNEQGKRYQRNEEISANFRGGIASFIVGIGMISAMSTLFNIWSWVGLFAPKLWIAHRLLNW